MQQRFVHLWFRYLATDRVAFRRPEWRSQPFVLASPERGRMVVRASNPEAVRQGIDVGMVVADARAVLPALGVMDDEPEETGRLLVALADWCIRYTPIVSVTPPDGLMLDVTGCTHLWGGEPSYLQHLLGRLTGAGYQVMAGMADTMGTAWAMAHYASKLTIVPEKGQRDALLTLPPAALRLEPPVIERMHKLGLYRIGNFIAMPRSVLRRRFGQQLLDRLDQALGSRIEFAEPIQPAVPYTERLPCIEPIVTATGIEIALKTLLESICSRLVSEGKGLRTALFKCFRVDGREQQIEIGTNRGSCHVMHLFKLFELKISSIAPGLGIELFVLEAPVVEDMTNVQEQLWNYTGATSNIALIELLDRLAGRAGMDVVHRYLPDQHHWPERSVKMAASLDERPEINWRTDRMRPMHLLLRPEAIDVTSVLPDYPPIRFIRRGKRHEVVRAEGPERIEQEWWIETGRHRDYYCVEDQEGARYWLFRLGHYDARPVWFLHGFFA